MKPVFVTANPRAKRDFQILEKVEAGISLLGSEVKAARIGRVSIKEAFAKIKDGEVWLYKAYFGEYPPAGKRQHDPIRRRKLLLRKREILRLRQKTQQQGLTLIPLRVYFNSRGWLKVELGLARGLKKYDKREVIKKKEQRRQIERYLRRRWRM